MSPDERPGRRVMMVAGEASGDLHGGNLAAALRRLDPHLTLFGIGGSRMRDAGVETRFDISELAVMGLVEVLRHYRRLRRILGEMQRLLREERPDLLITVDYPGFNLRLARHAKRLGIPVLHYISPQVWAWREHRVKQIAESVDRMAVLLPFEAPFYERHGIPVRFVGHPLVDEVRPGMERSEAQARFGIEPEHPVIGLLPGSRQGELKRLMPLLLESASRLRQRFPGLQFLLPLASSLKREEMEAWMEPIPADRRKESGVHRYASRHSDPVPITLVEGLGYDVMQCCDLLITASGTATLEAALMNVPMVIVYKVSPLTYAIARRMIKLPNVGLVNIVAGESIVPELIQHRARPDAVVAEAERFLRDPDHAEATREKLAAVREKLGQPGGSENVARLALEMLENGRQSAT